MIRLSLMLALLSSTILHAQQPATPSMGTVPTRDALVTGGLEVQGSTARLLTNASVTAYDHSAAISLARGGEVLVCATSQFHLLHSGTEDSLLFGLDRGAIEIHSPTQPQDVILTPDIRFTLEHPGHYDLRLRVTPNGDTCVENAGASAPVLTLSDPFSSAQYRLIPGQHVLFEHGSLREVVDNERSPCGCPAAPPAPTQQIAAAPTANPGQPVTPPVAAAEHPFPAAASVGLAPTPPPTNAAPAGEPHTQVSTVFTYDAAHPNTPPPSTVEPPKPAAAPTETSSTGSPSGTGNNTSPTPPPTPPGAHDLFHAIGHFFHKIFHHESKPAQPA
ncbi:MAG TPA: nuclease [Acidobacteriaceae bacterium]